MPWVVGPGTTHASVSIAVQAWVGSKPPTHGTLGLSLLPFSPPPLPPMSTHYNQLCSLARRSGVHGSIGALVSWDQETYMPPAGAAFRAEQLGLLAELHHKHATDQPHFHEVVGRPNHRGCLARALLIEAKGFTLAREERCRLLLVQERGYVVRCRPVVAGEKVFWVH